MKKEKNKKQEQEIIPKVPKSKEEKEGVRKIDNTKENALEEEIKKIEIPETKMIPQEMKVFCVEIQLENLKTDSGIILPASYQAGKKTHERKNLSRFFVVAMGDKVKEKKFGGKSLEIGDELLYHDVEDAVGVKHPEVIDYDLLDTKGLIRRYVVLDITEFAGIIKHEKA